MIKPTTTYDPSGGLMRTLPGSAYLDSGAFAAESDRIFWRQWFCVGRADELAGPGDFIRVEVAGQSVIVTRDRDGGLRGFYNVCRHRGSQLVPEEPAGRFKGAIKCPYHAWTYALDGRLRAAPFLTEGDGLRMEDLSLHQVAVDVWGGSVFVNLTPPEREQELESTLLEQLGGAAERTANYPLDRLVVGGSISYDVASNWKVIVENYNECYHCGPVHPELCEVVPEFKRAGGGDLDWDSGIPHRDGATTFTRTGTTTRAPFPGLSEEERVRHKGELIYPNLMLSLSADHVVSFTLWPVDAGRTRIDCRFLFHPDEVASSGFDPSDAVEFWDLVNRQDWRICESVQRGMSSRVFDSGYYAPMEDLALDIRRYLADRGVDVENPPSRPL